MGPLATVDFISKIIDETAASRDQDHLPLLVHSVPQIPDRTACLIESKASPLTALEQGLKTLVEAGVGCIAIPCNTAHYWHQPLAKISPVPILHIAQACGDLLQQQRINRVGLMATDGTLKADFYPRELAGRGIEVVVPNASVQQQIMDAIYQVKSGDVVAGAEILEKCVSHLLDQGVDTVILGCTEIPLALDLIKSPQRQQTLDATQALAAACVGWYSENKSLQAA